MTRPDALLIASTRRFPRRRGHGYSETRARWIILLSDGRVTEQASQAEPLAAGCLLANLQDPENNELGSDISGTP